jgi:excinuclease ABC subunit C
MLSEVVRRRFRRLQSERGTLPDLVLVDGGLTQVRAAEGALTELNLPQVAVAGLAKRMEEVYCGTGNQPVRLPPASPALRVLQWLRDEAHRFALGYHLRLRARRIRESVLDEIEGVGARRKERLLRHFGSVARLGRAAPPDIATVAGVSPAVAELIRAAARGGSAAGMT